MVFYECVLTAKNNAPFHSLTSLMKQLSHKVVEGGGIVRSIQNHGVRDLPHRFRAKSPDKDGNRYFSKGRFVSVYYDANPKTMRQVESILKLNEDVLRNTHLKARNKLWFVNIAREDRNPYIQKVLAMERRGANGTSGNDVANEKGAYEEEQNDAMQVESDDEIRKEK